MSRTIAICIPCGDFVDTEFCRCFSSALATHAVRNPDDVLEVVWRQGTLIAEQRNELCKLSLEKGADFIIFLDSDMTFPQDIIERLVSHDETVVAANCAKRRRPISPTARKEAEDDPSRLDAVWPDKAVTGLERIAVIGTAVMCIKSDVLFQIEWPYFAQPWMPDRQKFIGEDLYFCGMLKRAGVPLWLDHDLSWEIGHVGKYTYEMKDVLAEHQIAEAGLWDHLGVQAEPAKLEIA